MIFTGLKIVMFMVLAVSTAHCSDEPKSLVSDLPNQGNDAGGSGEEDSSSSLKALKLVGRQKVGDLFGAVGSCNLYVTKEEVADHYIMQVEAKSLHQGLKINALEVDVWKYAVVDSDGDGLPDQQAFKDPSENLAASQLVLAGVSRSIEGAWNPGQWADFEEDGTLKQYGLMQFNAAGLEDFTLKLTDSLKAGVLSDNINQLEFLSMQLMHGSHSDPLRCSGFKADSIVDYKFSFEDHDDHDHD